MESIKSSQFRKVVSKEQLEEMDLESLRSLLRDLYPQYKRDVTLIVLAFEVGIVSRLKQGGSRLSSSELEILTRSLYEDTGIEEQFCRLVVIFWAEVLGLDTKSAKRSKKEPAVGVSQLVDSIEPMVSKGRAKLLPGSRALHNVGPMTFAMRLAPKAMFPTEVDDKGKAKVDKPFWIAETQVTYELWYEVKMWAVSRGYAFRNQGREGSHGNTGQAPTSKRNQPVTSVSWGHSIIWCNALSEMLGCDPVYTHQGSVIREYRDEVKAVQEQANGFRLPTRCATHGT